MHDNERGEKGANKEESGELIKGASCGEWGPNRATSAGHTVHASRIQVQRASNL